MSKSETRVRRLEAAQPAADPGPGWVTVATPEEAEGLRLSKPTKVYIGIGPEAWSDEQQDEG